MGAAPLNTQRSPHSLQAPSATHHRALTAQLALACKSAPASVTANESTVFDTDIRFISREACLAITCPGKQITIHVTHREEGLHHRSTAHAPDSSSQPMLSQNRGTCARRRDCVASPTALVSSAPVRSEPGFTSSTCSANRPVRHKGPLTCHAAWPRSYTARKDYEHRHVLPGPNLQPQLIGDCRHGRRLARAHWAGDPSGAAAQAARRRSPAPESPAARPPQPRALCKYTISRSPGVLQHAPCTEATLGPDAAAQRQPDSIS